MIGICGSPGRMKYQCSECGRRPSTVRHAATIACPITCPPNTRCQLVFGLLPRNKFTSRGSRSRMEMRSINPLDIETLSISLVMRGYGKVSKFPPSGRENRDLWGPQCPGTAIAGIIRLLFRPPVSPSYNEVARVRVNRSSMSVQRSIVIGGGAFAGLALALALRQGLGADVPIIVADPALATRPSRDPRATAIVAACRRLFEAIGVWDQVADRTQPILDMVVTDSKLHDATRPVFLTFAGDVEPGEPFAHMVENRHLIDALVQRAEGEGVELRATAVTTFDARNGGVDVTFADGGVVEASLLVAADGARSRLRERAGIATHGWDYDQSGIVVTIGHERDHHGRAEEHFLPSGPFAILPLTGKRSSLVWTEKRSDAARIVALSEDE